MTTSGTSGSATITATLATGCIGGSVSVSKRVQVGPGEPTGRYVVGGFFSGSGTPLQTVNPAGPDKVNIIVDAPYNFTFTADPSYVSVSTQSGSQASFYMPANGNGVTITATATNATATCGLVGRWTFVPASYRLAVTPNPASTELTVTRNDADQSASAPAGLSARGQTTTPPITQEFDADLYNFYGKKVKTKHSDHGKAVLDVRDLPNGLYIVRVGQGREVLSEHIQVAH